LRILKGDARDTAVIHQHIVSTVETSNPDGTGKREVPDALHIRSLEQSELSRVVPNGHLAAELLDRAFKVTPQDTLISMEGAVRLGLPHVKYYEMRGAISTELAQAGVSHLVSRYVTGHTTRDIMNEYVTLADCLHPQMQRHFDGIKPLIAAIVQRAQWLGLLASQSP
jgi:hypothetical protein